MLLIAATSYHVLAKMAKMYLSYKTKVIERQRMCFAIFKVSFKFMRHYLRPYGGLYKKWLQYCRYSIAFNGRYIVHLQQKRSASLYLLPFLKEASFRRNLKDLFLTFYRRCMFMQKRMRACLSMNEAKLSVLMYYWGKKVFELKKKKSKEM